MYASLVCLRTAGGTSCSMLQLCSCNTYIYVLGDQTSPDLIRAPELVCAAQGRRHECKDRCHRTWPFVLQLCAAVYHIPDVAIVRANRQQAHLTPTGSPCAHVAVRVHVQVHRRRTAISEFGDRSRL